MTVLTLSQDLHRWGQTKCSWNFPLLSIVVHSNGCEYFNNLPPLPVGKVRAF